MRVRFFAGIKTITGCGEAEIPFEETAGDLALSLADLYGEKMRQKIFTPGLAPNGAAGTEAFNPEILFLINGRHANHLGGLSAPLKPDDRVDILPTVGGG